MEMEDALIQWSHKVGVASPIHAKELHRGANNRLYQIESTGQKYVLKKYFRHPGDARDRFGHEVAFLKYAQSIGLTQVPELLAADNTLGVILMNYVAGPVLDQSQDITAPVKQAITFLLSLNGSRNSNLARDLPPASEACFSLHDHLQLIKDRIHGLGSVEGNHRNFVDRSLSKAWRRLETSIRENYASQINRRLPEEERCISPSDFGFHNAILNGNRLVFMDFEYAGWDDPAKTICDFFCQPKIPVSKKFMPAMMQALAEALEDESLYERVHILLPAYQFKWCCILLNPFIPTDQERRKFAGGWNNVTFDPTRCLADAKALFDRIEAQA
jgi:hypothetical protein